MASIFTQRSNSYNLSSSKTTRRGYDVFLSFRGEDVRGNFLEYLYRALRQKGILTFKDDDKLQDGKNIKEGLSGAIEQSRFSIVVISKNYANSSWCLDELLHILECKNTIGQLVYPVFFYVEPSQVRHLGGKFGKGFAKAASENESKVKKWTEALEEVANLKGRAYPSNKFESEADLIDNLVRKIFSKSVDAYRIPSEGLVGVRYRMDQVIELLNLGSDETRVIGLWGMGGIGKTTLAKAVYESISWQFEGCSFLDNVREIFNRNGVLALQEHLISDILFENDFRVRSVMRGTSVIQNIVRGKKVLIVLDDVNDAKQIENLVEDLRRFSHGSRIIITTRDQQVLTVCGVQTQDIFKVQELNEDEAIELFKLRAFAKNGETVEFQSLTGRAIQYAKGVPLALKVLGSSLLDGNVPEWESKLERLRESPDDEVQQVLILSYDGLHWTEKKILLDICCFFKEGNKDFVVPILESCGFNPVFGIDVLVKKSLLSVSEDNTLSMHDLVQQMGWSIVDKESRNEPGERSRIWRPDDAKRVIVENTGTKKVEGIINLFNPENVQPRPNALAKMMRFLGIRGPWCLVDNVQPRPNALAKMINLRFLEIYGSWCPVDLPNKLRCLYWDGYPLRCMPSTFQPEYLVELTLTNSHIEQLWDGKVVLPKLILIDLSHVKSLTKCPDLTGFSNLEILIFQSCSALVDLHPSIKNLKRLKLVDMKDCNSLQTVPHELESQLLESVIFSGCSKLRNIFESFGEFTSCLELNGTGITEISQSIGNSTNLDYLDLSDCINLKSIPSSIGQLKKLKHLFLKRCSRLHELPEEIGLLDGLEILDVSFSGVRHLPTSFVCLRNIQTLKCQGCKATPRSYTGLESLTELDLSHCRLKSLPDSISLCVSLKTLDLSDNNFEILPTSMKNLNSLESFWLVDCKSLQELPELPSSTRFIVAMGCESLQTICCPTVYTDARVLYFAGCCKLKGTKEIKTVMGYRFLFSQIKENKHRSVSFRSYIGPGSKIPEWIGDQNAGGSLTLPLQDSNDSNFLGFAFSAVVITKGHYRWICVQMRIGGTIFNCGGDFIFSPNCENVMIFFVPKVDEFGMGGADLEVCFATIEEEEKFESFIISDTWLEPALEVIRCGAHLIYDEDVSWHLRNI